MAKIGKIQEVAIKDLKPYDKNAKLHPDFQVEKIADSINEFGFLNPCLIDKDKNLIAGHGRVEAAKLIGLDNVPCLFVEGLTEAQRRAYILADNRLTELGGWNMEIVHQELKDLQELDFDIELTGFDIGGGAEIDAEQNLHDDLSDNIGEKYEVIIECENEIHQENIYTKLTGEGLTCRILTL